MLGNLLHELFSESYCLELLAKTLMPHLNNVCWSVLHQHSLEPPFGAVTAAKHVMFLPTFLYTTAWAHSDWTQKICKQLHWCHPSWIFSSGLLWISTGSDGNRSVVSLVVVLLNHHEEPRWKVRRQWSKVFRFSQVKEIDAFSASFTWTPRKHDVIMNKEHCNFIFSEIKLQRRLKRRFLNKIQSFDYIFLTDAPIHHLKIKGVWHTALQLG